MPRHLVARRVAIHESKLADHMLHVRAVLPEVEQLRFETLARDETDLSRGVRLDVVPVPLP